MTRAAFVDNFEVYTGPAASPPLDFRFAGIGRVVLAARIGTVDGPMAPVYRYLTYDAPLISADWFNVGASNRLWRKDRSDIVVISSGPHAGEYSAFYNQAIADDVAGDYLRVVLIPL